jgi:hypothetical protein
MVKSFGSTGVSPLILLDLRLEEASGIAGVGVKSVNISRNTKCEGSLLGQF